MAGVNLTAAAMPTPIPAGRPRETRQTSLRTRARRNRLIWPRYSVWYTGSSARPRATTAATAVLDARPVASFTVITHAHANAATDANSHVTRAMTTGTAVMGANKTAANGG
jgi:hypothetical protein